MRTVRDFVTPVTPSLNCYHRMRLYMSNFGEILNDALLDIAKAVMVIAALLFATSWLPINSGMALSMTCLSFIATRLILPLVERTHSSFFQRKILYKGKYLTPLMSITFAADLCFRTFLNIRSPIVPILTGIYFCFAYGLHGQPSPPSQKPLVLL